MEQLQQTIRDHEQTIKELRARNEALTRELEAMRADPPSRQQATEPGGPSREAVLQARVRELEGRLAAPPEPTLPEALVAVWARLVQDRRLANVLPAVETPSVEQFEHLADVFAEVVWWLHFIDRTVRESFGILGQANERIAQIVRTLDQRRTDLRSELGRTFQLRRKENRTAPLHNYCFMFLYKPVFAVWHGYVAAIISAEKRLQEALNPDGWDFARARLEAEDAAIGRHLRGEIRRDLPVSFPAFLREEAARWALEYYNQVPKPTVK